MTRTLTLALLATLCLTAYAQDSEGPKPDRWRGLVIDQSTPDDAINVLGAPENDRLDRLRVEGVDDRWLTKEHKAKKFRRLEWKNAAGVKRAELSFSDGRLAAVYLEMSKEKKISAAGLSRIYGIEFSYKPEAGLLGMATDSFGMVHTVRRDGKRDVIAYPTRYHLVGQTDAVFVGAYIDNGGIRKFLTSTGDGDTAETGAAPGEVISIQLISRKLENRDGADVLK